jgi:serine/threonine protein kinase
MARKVLDKRPETYGRYEVLRKIAEGGMSSVYQGRHQDTGELVAIKVLTPALAANAVLRKRFEQEFRAARKLDHPHIVRGIDFGQEGDKPYLVLEFVDGPSLGDVIDRQGRLPEKEAVRIGVQVAQALGEAHRKRIIHRDVKPDNILLTREGEAKLTDLGLVKNNEIDLDLTRPSSGMGTLNFMAPEQFGDAKHADERCDVYSLGATLYFAITGELPFRAKGDLAVLKKKLTNQLTPPRRLVKELSERTNQAILRAVNAEPALRPASCGEFLQELGQASEDSSASGARRALSSTAGAAKRERRATVRYPSSADGNCRPIGGHAFSWSAKVLDISATGVQLLIRRRFEPGTVLALELRDGKKSARRSVLARVVRVQQQPDRKWALGCVLDYRLSQEDVQVLM